VATHRGDRDAYILHESLLTNLDRGSVTVAVGGEDENDGEGRAPEVRLADDGLLPAVAVLLLATVTTAGLLSHRGTSSSPRA